MRNAFALSALALATASVSFGQIATMGPETGTFNFTTRGYFFTAPTDLTITGIQVKLQTGSTNPFQNYAVVRFDNNTAPPFDINGTNAFTQLIAEFDKDQTVFQPVNVDIQGGN